MHLRRLLPVVFVLLLPALGLPAPEVLIVKSMAGTKDLTDADPTNTLPFLLAQELDNDGRVTPIAWGLADAIYRSAVNDGYFKHIEQPTVEQALEAANKLKVEYMFYVTVWRRENAIKAKAKLYRRGRQIWLDPDPSKAPDLNEKERREAEEMLRAAGQQVPPPEDRDARTLSILVGNLLDPENSLRSLASTWRQLLVDEPFKGHAPRPRLNTPLPTDGQQPVEIRNAGPVTTSNEQLLNDVRALVRDGKSRSAIALLRDAVDAKPLDLQRRKGLIETLENAGYTELAALEARRAVLILPEHPELAVLAARSWIRLQKLDSAIEDLNFAATHGGDSVETRTLLAEVSLLKGEYPLAIGHLDYVINAQPTADAHFKRALAKVLTGDAAGFSEDFSAAQKLGLGLKPDENLPQYELAIGLSSRAAEPLGPAVRDLIQKARLKPADAAVLEEVNQLLGKLEPITHLYEMYSAPARHAGSHQIRLLALKLLSQSINEVKAFLETKDEEYLGSATISLGEALKQMRAAEDAFGVEQGKG